MLARVFHPSDAKGLDEILQGKGITHQAIDEIIVTGARAHPQAVLCYRPGAFVHELELRGELRQGRFHAEALTNFAIARATAQGLKTAAFLVRADNALMHRFVLSIGAIKQTEPGDVLYTLTP